MRQLMEVDRHGEVREIVRDLKRRCVPLKDPRKAWTRKLWGLCWGWCCASLLLFYPKVILYDRVFS